MIWDINMSIKVNVKCFHKPDYCMECPFLSEVKYLCIDFEKNLFEQAAFCTFAQDLTDEEDVIRNSKWLMHNIEPWCPIEEVKE